MSEFLRMVLKAAFEAMRALRAGDSSLYEQSRMDKEDHQTLGADRLCEEIFVRRLSPFGTIHSEESGMIAGQNPSMLIALDPLDGSENFATRIPCYGASIALCDLSGAPQEAAIVSFISGDFFTKSGPEGKILSGNLHHPKRYKALKEGPKSPFELGIFEGIHRAPQIAAKLGSCGVKFRSLGALGISMMAARQAEFLLFEGKWRTLDTVAGFFLCADLLLHEEEGRFLLSRDPAVMERLLRIINQKG